MSTHQTKICGKNKSSPERNIHSIPSLPQQARKISDKPSSPTPKITRRTTTKPRASRNKETIKIRTEINDIETKKLYKRSMK